MHSLSRMRLVANRAQPCGQSQPGSHIGCCGSWILMSPEPDCRKKCRHPDPNKFSSGSLSNVSQLNPALLRRCNWSTRERFAPAWEERLITIDLISLVLMCSSIALVVLWQCSFQVIIRPRRVDNAHSLLIGLYSIHENIAYIRKRSKLDPPYSVRRCI